MPGGYFRKFVPASIHQELYPQPQTNTMQSVVGPCRSTLWTYPGRPRSPPRVVSRESPPSVSISPLISPLRPSTSSRGDISPTSSNMPEATLVEAVVVDGDPDAPEVERQPARDEAKHNSQY